MSIITVLKEADTLIFSTDSRMMAHDNSGIVSDAERKIFEIAPGTFIATSGRKVASQLQVARARILAFELSTTDIQAIGAALARESLPWMLKLVARLRMEPDEVTRHAVSGDTMLHGCTLVGRAAGKLGYVTHSYWVQPNGTVEYKTEAYFEAPRKVTAISGTPAGLMGEIACRFVCDPATWIDPLEQVSMRFLEAVKLVTPTIGGPYQVLRLDSAGAHWLSRPPAADPAPQTAAGTCNATVSFTSPSIEITAGATVINLDATNLFKISKSGWTQQLGTGLSSGFGSTDGVVITTPGGLQATIQANGILVGTTSGTAGIYSSLASGSLEFFNGGSNAQLDYSGLTINGVHSVKARYGSTPVTLADVIALLQYHGLCV
jgi:hypothetical protein